MKKGVRLVMAFVLLALVSCGGYEDGAGYGAVYENDGDYYVSPEAMPELIDYAPAPEAPVPIPVNTTFVDERYELLALIFRLAGRPEFNASVTEYQNALNTRFAEYRAHPAVLFAGNLPLGFDAVGRFAVHMEREGGGFTLIDDIYFLFECGRWTESSAARFIVHVNGFYTDTNFASFFQEHMPYFEEHSERFISQLYDDLNKDWFIAHGLSPEAMRVILAPGDGMNGYGASIYNNCGDKLAAYAILPVSPDYSRWKGFLVHEFVHSFANPIAFAWYEENETFRRQSDDSVDLVRMPTYNNGRTMAGEYVTRAFTILYLVESDGADPFQLLLGEAARGFPYIAYVYAMITGDEPIDLSNITIGRVLGFDYALGEEEHSFDMGDGRVIRWRVVDLLGQEIRPEDFSHVTMGNIFNTHTGDVLYVTISGNTFLYIDLGPAGEQWSPAHRSYSVFPLGVK